MNNRGQSLVLFVVILPVLLLLLVLIVDVGKLIILKLELNNISEIVLDYGLDNLEDENLYSEMTKLVKMNKNDIDNVNIDIIDNKIYLKLSHNDEPLFKNIINVLEFKIETSYVGYILDDKKRIERLGD
jgi:hypothetical protein